MIKIIKTKYIVNRNQVYDGNEPSGYVSNFYDIGYYAIRNDCLLFPFPGDLFNSIEDLVYNFRDGCCYMERNPYYNIDEKFSEIVAEYESEQELYMEYPEFLI